MSQPMKAREFWLPLVTLIVNSDKARSADDIHVIEAAPVLERIAELEALNNVLKVSRDEIRRDCDRLSKSYNFDQQKIKELEAANQSLVEQVNKILDEKMRLTFGMMEVVSENDSLKRFDAGFIPQLQRAHKASDELKDSQLAKRDEAIKVMREALMEYAEGTALRIKPEKLNLYSKHVQHGDPMWLQRSMSDHDHGLLSKQALEKADKILKGEK